MRKAPKVRGTRSRRSVPARPRRNLTELKAAKAHVLFEVQALLSAITGLARPQHQQVPNLLMVALLSVRQALIDSMAIHARGFFHFAYPVGRVHPDDILAVDFIDDWDVRRPPWPPELSDIRARVARDVAHLSYQRIGITEEEVSRWNLPALVDAIRGVLEAFRSGLPTELADPEGSDVPPTPAGELPYIFPRWPPR